MTLINSLRKRNLPTSCWNRLPQFLTHASSVYNTETNITQHNSQTHSSAFHNDNPSSYILKEENIQWRYCIWIAGNGQDPLASNRCQMTRLKQVRTAFEYKTNVTRLPTYNPHGSRFIHSLHFLFRRGHFRWPQAAALPALPQVLQLFSGNDNDPLRNYRVVTQC